MKKAVFLDRDGTLNHDFGYIKKKEEVVLISGSAEAVKKLRQKGFLVLVVSNQAGVGRGLMSVEDVEEVNRQLQAELVKAGTQVDAFYYCPHAPEVACSCRKPSPALVQKAATRFQIDLARSYFVGDKWSDVETGIAAGCKTVFLSAGSNEEKAAKPHFVAPHLPEACEWILKDLEGENHV